jgi:hypothetical protein
MKHIAVLLLLPVTLGSSVGRRIRGRPFVVAFDRIPREGRRRAARFARQDRPQQIG